MEVRTSLQVSTHSLFVASSTQPSDTASRPVARRVVVGKKPEASGTSAAKTGASSALIRVACSAEMKFLIITPPSERTSSTTRSCVVAGSLASRRHSEGKTLETVILELASVPVVVVAMVKLLRIVTCGRKGYHVVRK